MMVGEIEVKERPRPSPDYLMQLLNEKKLMTSLPNLCGIFTHLDRLLDEGKRPWRNGVVGREGVTTALSLGLCGHACCIGERMHGSYLANIANELHYRTGQHNFFF